MKTRNVGPDFSAFLTKELGLGCKECAWRWREDGSVGCGTCGSGYPLTAVYYLRRIFKLLQEVR
jgi:hypothetical protein